MKVILFGASGMVGAGALRESLRSSGSELDFRNRPPVAGRGQSSIFRNVRGWKIEL
jgi:hypothetical protein